MNQYFRQMAPNTGPFDPEVTSAAAAALFERIGPGILVSHSQSGGLGWRTAIKNRNVRAIAAYEPGSGFIFSDLNNLQIADLLSAYLKEKGLDGDRE